MVHTFTSFRFLTLTTWLCARCWRWLGVIHVRLPGSSNESTIIREVGRSQGASGPGHRLGGSAARPPLVRGNHGIRACDPTARLRRGLLCPIRDDSVGRRLPTPGVCCVAGTSRIPLPLDQGGCVLRLRTEQLVPAEAVNAVREESQAFSRNYLSRVRELAEATLRPAVQGPQTQRPGRAAKPGL